MFCCGLRSAAAMARAMAVKNRMMVRTAVDRATMRLHSRDRLRVTSSILSVARRDEGGRSFDADSVEVTLRLV